MRPKPNQAFIVSHTHWDREWYLTSSQFRVMLGETVDRVLDALDHDPEFRQFVLDGQSAALEDYLEISPPDSARGSTAWSSEGRLKVGPWYILPDEFLVSGEATVRNLMFGRKAAPLKKVQNVGYMPDSFGHPGPDPPDPPTRRYRFVHLHPRPGRRGPRAGLALPLGGSRRQRGPGRQPVRRLLQRRRAGFFRDLARAHPARGRSGRGGGQGRRSVRQDGRTAGR